MKTVPFEMLKRQFAEGDIEEKVRLYVETEDLTKEQYGELLRMFPIHELQRLEDALYAQG